jgi:hypothetical protein
VHLFVDCNPQPGCAFRIPGSSKDYSAKPRQEFEVAGQGGQPPARTVKPKNRVREGVFT